LTDIFLKSGEANPNDIRLVDPTTASSPGGGVTVNAVGAALAIALGTVAVIGADNTSAVGRQLTVILGTETVTGGAGAQTTGLSLTSTVGTVTVTGGDNTAALGLSMTISLGTVTVQGDFVPPPPDVPGGGGGRGAGHVWEEIAPVTANAEPTGLQMRIQLGRVTIKAVQRIPATAKPRGLRLASKPGRVRVNAVRTVRVKPAGFTFKVQAGECTISAASMALPAGLACRTDSTTARVRAGAVARLRAGPRARAMLSRCDVETVQNPTEEELTALLAML